MYLLQHFFVNVYVIFTIIIQLYDDKKQLTSRHQNSTNLNKFMNKSIALIIGMAAMCLSASADNTQTVVVDGTTVNKNVTRLTFSGDDVVMTFADNTSQTADMSLVSINFSYSPSTAISRPEVETENAVKKVYNLNGQYMGNSTEGLPKGLYIVNGKKMVIR